MITLQTALAFFTASLLLSATPGPDNLFVLMQSATAGRRAGLSVVLGLCTGLLVHTSAVALGLAALFAASALAFTLLKIAGSAYLLYLAWGFFRASVTPDNSTRPQKAMGFRDGFICVALNPKIHSMIVVMFAQFLTPGASLSAQVTQLSAAFVVLGLFCHFPWIYGGQVILGRFNTPRAVRIQAAIFGASMLAVAAYVVLT